jgi:thioredoxin reductase (NADPH)
MPEPSEAVVDIAIIGGGPVGLHAAHKAALMNHTTILFDMTQRYSRAFFIPRINNLPGIPEPISGRELLKRLRACIDADGPMVKIYDSTRVARVERKEGHFIIRCEHLKHKDVVGASEHLARTVLIATGNIDRQPEIGGSIRTILPYADKGIAVYCVLCDGHTFTGKNVGVIGHTDSAVWIAVHATKFAKEVTLLTHGKRLFEGEDASEGTKGATIKALKDFKINVFESEIRALFGLKENVFGVKLADGAERKFDRGLVALGFYKIHNDIALQLGAKLMSDGFIVTDGDKRVLDKKGVPIPGVYAVGDITENWKQIPVGWGDAEVAVLHIHTEYLWD